MTDMLLRILWHGSYRPGRQNLDIEAWYTAWSDDERRVFTVTLLGKLRAWDVTGAAESLGRTVTEPAATVEFGGTTREVATNADGSRVLIRSNQMIVWDGLRGETLFTDRSTARWNPARSLLAIWEDGGVRIRSIASGETLALLPHEERPLGAQWLDDTWLLTWDEGEIARLWQFDWQLAPLIASSLPPPSPTPTPSLTPSDRYAGNEAPEENRLQINRNSRGGQTFVARDSFVSSVEIHLRTNAAFGDRLTLHLLTRDGQALGRAEQFAPGGYDGWLPFFFPEPIPATPGLAYRLELASREGLSSWQVSGDSYHEGVAYLVAQGDTWRYYSLEANPLIGVWAEEVQFTCANNTAIEPPGKIGELVFRADGSFLVTWYPFEVYVDYEGTYSYDAGTGRLSLSPQAVNYLPPNIAAQGAARIDAEGRLVLEGIFLGTAPDAPREAANCGHRFVRRGGTRW